MGKVKLAQQLKDTNRLIEVASLGVTDIVQTMHQRIASGPAILGRPLAPLVKVFTRPTYGAIKMVTRAVSASISGFLDPLDRLLPLQGLERGPLLAALNGVLGDYLVETQSSLALPMQLCFKGQALTCETSTLRHIFPEARPLLILLHGSSVDEQSWQRKGWNYGEMLAEECAYIPLYLRYNTGLHISDNGKLFAKLLDELWSQWPWPIQQINLVGHSMGGLVALSALHQAKAQGLAWRYSVKTLMTLGSPYHGSPLERGGNVIDTTLSAHPFTEPLAQLGKIRSSGVTDLRFGSILEEHWQGQDRFAWTPDPRPAIGLPQGVHVCAVAATRSAADQRRLQGDGLVPLASALGQHKRPELCLPIAKQDQCVIYESNHLDLLSHPAVYTALKGWLSS